ncbi:MAG TPA: ribonuclease III [Oceanospirillales bacterium]|nr:ribonuclease III [Oceanospirillales bacterium]
MQKILGQSLSFDDPKLLTQALTHRSAGKSNNERLEFLGDSILSFVITKWLFQRFPQLSEGKLSRMRANLVKGITLAEVARHYNLGDKLILGVGELKSGGFNRSSVLADVVEALFGAIFLDKGIDATEKFILTAMSQWLEKINPNISDKDAKTRLQELVQKQGFAIPSYKLIGTQGEDHLKTFEICCNVEELSIKQTALNRSRKKAEQAAAQKVLKLLEKS